MDLLLRPYLLWFMSTILSMSLSSWNSSAWGPSSSLFPARPYCDDIHSGNRLHRLADNFIRPFIFNQLETNESTFLSFKMDSWSFCCGWIRQQEEETIRVWRMDESCFYLGSIDRRWKDLKRDDHLGLGLARNNTITTDVWRVGRLHF